MKKISFIILAVVLSAATMLNAQSVGINADGSEPNSSAMLDVSSTDKGFLAPRMTESQKSAIATPATGLLVYQTDSTPGYYYYTGTVWVRLDAGLTVTLTPPGVVQQYGGVTAPEGYFLCQGQAVSRTTYAALFATIGTTYGSGDGSGTFNLPDLRSKIAVGYNASESEFNALNKQGGSKNLTLTTGQLPSHSHTFSGNTNSSGNHSHGGQTGSAGAGLYWKSLSYQSGSTNLGWAFVTSDSPSPSGGGEGYQNPHLHSITADGVHTHELLGTTSNSGSGQPVPVLQPYIVLNYIIKY